MLLSNLKYWIYCDKGDAIFSIYPALTLKVMLWSASRGYLEVGSIVGSPLGTLLCPTIYIGFTPIFVQYLYCSLFYYARGIFIPQQWCCLTLLVTRSLPADLRLQSLEVHKYSVISSFSFKAVGVIDASPETCFKYCDPKPDGKRVKWDKAIKELEVIEYLRKDDPVSFWSLLDLNIEMSWPICDILWLQFIFKDLSNIKRF